MKEQTQDKKRESLKGESGQEKKLAEHARPAQDAVKDLDLREIILDEQNPSTCGSSLDHRTKNEHSGHSLTELVPGYWHVELESRWQECREIVLPVATGKIEDARSLVEDHLTRVYDESLDASLIGIETFEIQPGERTATCLAVARFWVSRKSPAIIVCSPTIGAVTPQLVEAERCRPRGVVKVEIAKCIKVEPATRLDVLAYYPGLWELPEDDGEPHRDDRPRSLDGWWWVMFTAAEWGKTFVYVENVDNVHSALQAAINIVEKECEIPFQAETDYGFDGWRVEEFDPERRTAKVYLRYWILRRKDTHLVKAENGGDIDLDAVVSSLIRTEGYAKVKICRFYGVIYQAKVTDCTSVYEYQRNLVLTYPHWHCPF